MIEILFILLGFAFYFLIKAGFNDYEFDYLENKHFPKKWHNIMLVKEWTENFIDKYGKGTHFFIKRFNKNYILKYESITATRLNKKFEEIYKNFN